MNDYGQGIGDVAQGAGMGTMALPGIGTAIGAGLGLGKYFLLDRPNYQRQLQLAAATARLSPWTGLHANEWMPHQKDILGETFNAAGTGNQIGGQITKSGEESALNKAQTNGLNAQSNFYNNMNYGQKSAEAPIVVPNNPIASQSQMSPQQDFYRSYLSQNQNNNSPYYDQYRMGS